MSDDNDPPHRASGLILNIIGAGSLTRIDLKNMLADMCALHVLLRHERSPWPIIKANLGKFLSLNEVKMHIHKKR